MQYNRCTNAPVFIISGRIPRSFAAGVGYCFISACRQTLLANFDAYKKKTAEDFSAVWYDTKCVYSGTDHKHGPVIFLAAEKLYATGIARNAPALKHHIARRCREKHGCRRVCRNGNAKFENAMTFSPRTSNNAANRIV